ncbi:hypothetical protein C3F09_06760 [candidate division GN15 bacterium]|uniref:SH3 domain-containing protein n=1 Tax=candidate division GN15 bacterium TaxID=2072418 RepID=A0A855X6X8_9BACT|nr:MAG: hypothetical protein C3F09_06760 [candidate division GN15 bacterium]
MPIRHHAAIPSLVIAPHIPKFTQFMKVKAGEIVTVGKEDDEYPGWLWCTDSRGLSNWVPKEFLKMVDASKPQGLRPTNESISNASIDAAPSAVEGRAELLVDYDATELTVQVGESVTVYGEQSGWLWCLTASGKWGWIPKECVAR